MGFPNRCCRRIQMASNIGDQQSSLVADLPAWCHLIQVQLAAKYLHDNTRLLMGVRSISRCGTHAERGHLILNGIRSHKVQPVELGPEAPHCSWVPKSRTAAGSALPVLFSGHQACMANQLSWRERGQWSIGRKCGGVPQAGDGTTMVVYGSVQRRGLSADRFAVERR